jgi:hypothetical protein
MTCSSSDNAVARSSFRCDLFDVESISFDVGFIIYINGNNIPPIMIINMIYENQNFLVALNFFFLVRLRTPQLLSMSFFILVLTIFFFW